MRSSSKPLPDESARREIFAVHLRAKPLVPNIDLDDLAARTEGHSGADIASICHKAALGAIRKVMQTVGAVAAETAVLAITQQDIEQAMAEVYKAKEL